MRLVKLHYVFIALVLVSCRRADQALPHAELQRVQKSVRECANKTVALLEEGNWQGLAMLIHPQKGVRFSPRAYVEPKSDLIFQARQIASFGTDNHKYTWGSFVDEQGPMTAQQYIRKFVCDREYSKAPEIRVNNDRSRPPGGSNNNAATVYPGAARVEYYFPPSAPDLLNWSLLRLVLEQYKEQWYVIGIIHDNWEP